jgi:hypothetical protein
MKEARIRILEIGDRKKGSKEFGYRVMNDVDNKNLDYQNRARLVNGRYLLEETLFDEDGKSPYNQIALLARNQEKADIILYGRAKLAIKKALETLTVKLIDETQMFKKLRKKEEAKYRRKH